MSKGILLLTYGFTKFDRHFSDNTLYFYHGHIGILIVGVTGIIMFKKSWKRIENNFSYWPRSYEKPEVKGDEI